MSIENNAKLVAGTGAALFAADQAVKSFENEDDHRMEHIINAGIGAAIAVGAYHMLKSSSDHHAHHSSASSSTRQHSEPPPHRNLILAEEIIGIYNLGKELMGDKKHHVRHLIGEAFGVAGLMQQLREREREQEEEAREEKGHRHEEKGHEEKGHRHEESGHRRGT